MKSDDLGKLILRLVLGILILLHGLFNVTHGVGGVASILTQHNLPGFLAYFVFVGEVLAPILLIMGIYACMSGLLIAGSMLVAFFLAHKGRMASLNAAGGWALKLQGMFLFAALAVFFMGAGRFSLAGSGGRWN